MEPIVLYFEKFKKFVPPERFLRRAVVASIAELVGEAVAEESVKVRGSTVFISAHPTIKAEVFMRKKELLDRISEKLSIMQVGEVR